MGADLLISHIWTTKKDEELDWEHGLAKIQTLPLDDLRSYYEFDDDKAIEDIRSDFTDSLLLMERIWEGEELRRDVSVCTLGPIKVMLSAGVSWGDSPTEFFDTMEDMPFPVLQAVGFFE